MSYRPICGDRTLVGKTNGLYDNSGVLICCMFCDLLLFLGPPKKKKEAHRLVCRKRDKGGVRCSMVVSSQGLQRKTRMKNNICCILH